MSGTEVQVRSLDELESLARHLVRHFKSRQVVRLQGPMGAGKTELVRALIRVLGGAAVSSPTFAIHNVYETSRGPVDHVDLYRLERDDELQSVGFWDLFARDAGLILVEWADRLPLTAWPRDWNAVDIALHPEADHRRRVQVSPSFYLEGWK